LNLGYVQGAFIPVTRTSRSVVTSPLTTSRKDLLDAGSDGQVRSTIHMLIGCGVVMEKLSQGLGHLNGVTGIQHQILAALQRLKGGEGVSIAELARYVRRSGAFVTIEVGKLIKFALIEKSIDPRDTRRVLLRLAAEGHRRMTRLAPFQRRVNDVLFAGMSAKRFRELSILLEQMLADAERAADTLEIMVRETRRSAISYPAGSAVSVKRKAA